MLHYGASAASVIIIDIKACFAGLALVFGIAVEALWDEKVAKLAMPTTRVVVVGAFFTVIFILAVLALRKCVTLDAFAPIRIKLILNALGASITIEAYLTPREDAGAQLTSPIFKEIVSIIAFSALVLASALRAMRIEGIACNALSCGRIEIISWGFTVDALVSIVAVQASN